MTQNVNNQEQIEQALQNLQDAKVTQLLHDASDKSDETSASLDKRMLKMENRVSALEVSVSHNTTLTTQISNDTREILDLFLSVKGGFRVMGWLGALAKWSAGFVTIFAAIYAFVQNLKGFK
jgi:hypothetical protein